MLIKRMDVSPDGQGAHLAVSDEQQPNAVDDLQHPVDGRNVQRIIRLVASHHFRHQRQPQGIQCRHHHFDLCQAGIIFAVSILEQGLFSAGVIARHRGRIQPHPLRRQFIHPQDAAPQFGFDGLPGLGIAQSPQQERQAIIREIQFSHLHPGDPLDRLTRLSHPGLHRLLARIALAHDVRQPDRCNPTPTQALVQPVSNQVIVNDRRQTQPLHHFQQKRKVVYSFCGNVHLRVHPLSLSANSRFR